MVLSTLAAFLVLLAPVTPVEPRHLAPGTGIGASIRSGQVHSYLIELRKGQAADVVVEQDGTDLASGLFSPAGGKLAEIDTRESGPEPIVLLATETGGYRIDVTPVEKEAAPAQYRVIYRACRLQEPTDAARIRALIAGSAGKRQMAQPSPDSERVIGFFNEALAIWRELGDHENEAAVLSHIGTIHNRNGDYSRAVSYHQEARSISESIGAPWTQGESLNNLAMDQWRAGEFADAARNLEKALAIWKRVGHRYGQAAALSNLGILNREIGEYQRARSYYSRALPLLRALGDRAHQAYVYSNLGVLMSAMGEHRRGIGALQLAGTLFHAAHNDPAEARAIVQEARIRVAVRQLSVARQKVLEAIPLSEKSHDIRSLADGWTVLAQIESESGSKEKAAVHLENALEAFQRAGDRGGRATALHAAGVLRVDLGDDIEARRLLTSALELRRELGIRDGEAETLFRLAQIDLRRGELDTALASAERAIELVDSLRGLIAGPQRRISYMAQKESYYELAVAAAVQLHHARSDEGFAARGLEISERGRARALLDVLDDSRRLISPGPGTRAEKLRHEFNFWAARLSNGTTAPGDIPALRARVADLIDRFHDLEAEIHAANPMLSPKPLRLGEIQALLDTRTLLLEYAFAGKDAVVWAIGRESLAMYILRPVEELQRAAKEYYRMLSAPGNPGQAGPASLELRQAARRLSSMLLGPLAPLPGQKRLIVSAPGWLAQIPFGALPEPGAGETPMLVTHEIIYMPSASVYAAHEQRIAGRLPTRNSIAAFADPVFDTGDVRLRSREPGTKARFGRLPYTRAEAESITALAGPDQAWTALGFEANRENVINGLSGRYRIVHLATHADIDTDRPELSGLVFSLVDERGRPRDGYLRLLDIANLRSRADLVTLSACGTALGKMTAGEGVIGLARGFLYAGAGSVMVSLWNIEDEATSEWMRAFYSGILGPRHQDAAAALRSAQLAMWNSKRWRHPYYWAAWMLVGAR